MLIYLKKIIFNANIQHFIVALFFGSLGQYAFAPYHYYYLIILNYIILFFQIRHVTAKKAFYITLIYHTAYFFFGLHWITVSINNFSEFSTITADLLVLLLSIYLALFASCAITIGHYYFSYVWYTRVLSYPALFTLSELLREKCFTGFNWLSLGYSQVDSLLSPIASYLSVYGISLYIILLAILIVEIIHRHQYALYITLFCLMSVFFIPTLLPIQTNKSIQVSLIQGNINQHHKFDNAYYPKIIQTYLDLIHKSIKDSDLIILSESAIPTITEQALPLLSELNKLAHDNKNFILTGIIEKEQQKYYNSLLLLGEHQIFNIDNLQKYRKQHLLPIGEFIPFENLLRKLDTFFNLPYSSFNSGSAEQPQFKFKSFHVASSICYEIIFPELIRHQINEYTDFLITVSNDTWFSQSHGPDQHMQIAQMRNIELGLPLIRVTNDGITGIITNGQLIAQLPTQTQAILQEQITLEQYPTVYKKYGLRFLYIICTLFMLSTIFFYFTKRKQ